MPNARKIVRSWQLILSSQRWITGRDFGVVPKKLENRKNPLFWEESTLPQEPGAIGILETIDGIAKHSRVTQIQDRIFIVTLSRGRSIWKQLVQVGIANIAEPGVMVSRIYAGGGALQFGEKGQAGPCDAHVVHGLVVTAFRRNQIRGLKDIG